MKSLMCFAASVLLIVSSLCYGSEPVNINTADAETLAQAIKGVGLKRAQAIVAYRLRNGPFVSVEDLANVQGIGMKTIESSREKLTVDNGGS